MMNSKLIKVQEAYDAFVQPFQGEIVDGDLEKSLKLAKKLYQATIRLYLDESSCLEAEKYLSETTNIPKHLNNAICRLYGINAGICGLYFHHARKQLYGELEEVINNIVSPGCYYEGDKGPFWTSTHKGVVHSLTLRVELIDKLLKQIKQNT